MNRKQLIAAVRERANLSARDWIITAAAVEVTIDAVLVEIKAAVARNETVTLVGFGTFTAKPRAARKSRNPKTGDPVMVPARVVPVFKPSSVFRAEVDGRLGGPTQDGDA